MSSLTHEAPRVEEARSLAKAAIALAGTRPGTVRPRKEESTRSEPCIAATES